MAIVKASYTKSRAGAKASIRYIEHRPGKDGAKITRPLFGIDGLMGRDQAYRLINEAGEGSFFYRFALSPDPKLEDTKRDLYLREVTEKTMQTLMARLKQEVAWVAAEHDDHAPNRHVHVVAVVPGKLYPQDFQAMLQRATEAALFQRKERDLAREQQPRRWLARARWLTRAQAAPGFAREFPIYSAKGAGRQLAHVRPANTFQTCLHCGYLQVTPLSKGVQTCLRCGWKLYQPPLQRLNIKEAQWER
jgi:putative transposase-like DNA-binding protein